MLKSFASIRHRDLSEKLVSSQQAGKLNSFYGQKKHALYPGLEVPENTENTYLPKAIPVVCEAVDYSNDVTAQIAEKLARADNDPNEKQKLRDYFVGALGTTDQETIDMAIERLKTINEGIIQLQKYTKDNHYQNIQISSSIRPP